MPKLLPFQTAEARRRAREHAANWIRYIRRTHEHNQRLLKEHQDTATQSGVPLLTEEEAEEQRLLTEPAPLTVTPSADLESRMRALLERAAETRPMTTPDDPGSIVIRPGPRRASEHYHVHCNEEEPL